MNQQQTTRRASRSSVPSRLTFDPGAQFKHSLLERFFVRFHMTLLLSGVCISGLLVSKLLLEFGLRSMFVRYLIAVCVSYVIFFLLIRMWLWYVGASSKDEPSPPDLDIVDAVDVGQMSLDGVRVGADGASDVVSGGGGDFGGGGATDMWGDVSGGSGTSVPSSAMTTASSGSSGHGGSSGGSGGGGFDLGDEAIVLVALALLLLAIFGAGAYLVYAAPNILSEAAFEAMLAAGLIKASRKMTRQGWMGSVLRATCIPFLIVLLMTGVFGWVAHKYCPHATRLADIFTNCSSQKR